MLFAFIVTLAAGLATCIGGWLGTNTRILRPAPLAASLAFAAGLMIAISVIEIAPAAIRSMREIAGTPGAWLSVLGVMILGGLAVVAVDRLVPHHLNPAEIGGGKQLERINAGEVDRRLLRSGMVLALVVGLHNLPEGMATFLSTLNDPAGGVLLAVGIAIHNVPEGLAVAAPIYAATRSTGHAFFWAALSGLAEPLGALVGYLLVIALLPAGWLNLTLALVAGMMIAVSAMELIPAARRYETHYRQTVVGFGAGVAVMVLSLVTLAAST